jgi:hypothetical protein
VLSEGSFIDEKLMRLRDLVKIWGQLLNFNKEVNLRKRLQKTKG